jgi:hypothetical protein
MVIGQRHDNVIGAAHDVSGGDDVAVGTDDEAGPQGFYFLMLGGALPLGSHELMEELIEGRVGWKGIARHLPMDDLGAGAADIHYRRAIALDDGGEVRQVDQRLLGSGVGGNGKGRRHGSIGIGPLGRTQAKAQGGGDDGR